MKLTIPAATAKNCECPCSLHTPRNPKQPTKRVLDGYEDDNDSNDGESKVPIGKLHSRTCPSDCRSQSSEVFAATSDCKVERYLHS